MALCPLHINNNLIMCDRGACVTELHCTEFQIAELVANGCFLSQASNDFIVLIDSYSPVR